ncbi:MAG: hypothetical protein IJV56_08700 [Neisseriaceae bacterium]|nr:hypothetical protein [Neisseriaceae bacterium]
MKLPKKPTTPIKEVLEINYKIRRRTDDDGNTEEFPIEEIRDMKVLCEDGSIWIKDCLTEIDEWTCIAFFCQEKNEYIFDGKILKQDYRFIDKSHLDK